MNKAKNRAKKKNEKRKEFNKEIVGIIILSFSILSLFSLYSDSTGYFGQIIRNGFKNLAGFGGYFIPYILLTVGVLLSLNKLNLNEKKKSISLFIIFISFLTFLHIKYYIVAEKSNFMKLIKISLELSKKGKGGGLLGAVSSYLNIKIFGVIGSYIVIISSFSIAFLTLTNISLVTIIKNISLYFFKILKNSFDLLKSFIYVEKIEKSDIINSDKTIELLNFEGNESKNVIKHSSKMEEKIKILDFTKNEQLPETNDVNKTTILSNTDISVVFNKDINSYKIPPLNLLIQDKQITKINEKKDLMKNAKKLESTLENFGIKAKVIQINKGPTVTRYELQPAPGVKVSKIINLTNDIALSLATANIRIEAPIPGKAAIGIEVPNKNKTSVRIREILQSETFKEIDTKIPFALGKDIAGNSIVASIEKMPHLLIAGATGSGKSVSINALIISILYNANPNEVKLLLIDPKVVELSIYNKIPHLLIPVVTDPKKASSALNWAVQEMTKRYNIFAQNGVRDIFNYNKRTDLNKELDRLPQIVIIIDELADLMMVSPKEVEDSICRLAQMARAAGIYLVIATQRPSVDIITGTIKANIPSRISFAVTSQTDSRTILDMSGAEKLLGKGDMLFYPVGSSKPIRIQGVYVDEKEIEKVVEFLKNQTISNYEYEEDLLKGLEEKRTENNDDNLLPEAIELVINEGKASISFLQRKLRIGYTRASRLIDEMEKRGIVGGYQGSKPRKILLNQEELNR